MKNDIVYIIKRVVIGVLITLCIISIKSCSVNAAVVDGCIDSGTSLKSVAKIGSQYVGSNYYYEKAPNAWDESSLNVNFCTDWDIISNSQTGTRYVNFSVDYCVNGAFTQLEIWSKYNNNVDYTYPLNTNIYLSNGDWSRASCYRSYISLNMNYTDNLGTGNNDFTTYTNNNNVFALKANDSFNKLIRYTDLVYYNSKDYDTALQNAQKIGQQNTLINQNTNINNSVNDLNTSINDSSTSSPNSGINAVKNGLANNGVITQLITLPVTLFQQILNSINGTCQPFNLGSLFGTDLTMPCINISNYLGSALWGIIDVIISGYFVWVIGRKMISAFEMFSSMKDGDVLDD